jgi:hypothetical protein
VFEHLYPNARLVGFLCLQVTRNIDFETNQSWAAMEPKQSSGTAWMLRQFSLSTSRIGMAAGIPTFKTVEGIT